jgi:hypothetical protein
MQSIQKILSSKTLHIKALTSAGIISGIVTDIFSSCSSNKKQNFLKYFADYLSKSNSISLEQNNLTYVVEQSKLYPISNLESSVFLDRIELDASKIIALCPLFGEAD